MSDIGYSLNSNKLRKKNLEENPLEITADSLVSKDIKKNMGGNPLEITAGGVV